MESPVSIRMLEDGDRAYCATRWIQNRVGNAKARSKFARSLGIDLTRDVTRRYSVIVDELLDEGDTYMLVERAHTDNLLGFVTLARGLLAFVYVDKDLRGQGYGRGFLNLAKKECPSMQSLHPVVGWKWQKDLLRTYLNVPKANAA